LIINNFKKLNLNLQIKANYPYIIIYINKIVKNIELLQLKYENNKTDNIVILKMI